MDCTMFAIYGCLLALISSGFSFPEALPWDTNYVTRLSTRKNDYGASAGFKQANIKDYPFVTSITYEWKDILLFPASAGAILNKHWVLSTAYASVLHHAHTKLYIGSNYAGRSGQRIRLSKMITHEKFNFNHSLAYNIALLKTYTPITFSDKVKPVKLVKSLPKAGTGCTLLGFGYVQDRPYVGWDLGVATVQIKPQKQCVKEHGPLKSAFCAEADGVVPCVGDVGGLLMHKNKLVGLYVVGDYCNRNHTAEVYTNVSAMKKWIWKTIKANSNDDEMKGLSTNEFLGE